MRHRQMDHGHPSRSFRSQCACLLGMVLMMVTGCGNVIITFSRTPPPPPTMNAHPASTITLTPTPTPSAVSATDPAGWVAATSSNWCGYTFPQGQITGVRAQWTEPVISAHVPGAYLVTWVGLSNYWKRPVVAVAGRQGHFCAGCFAKQSPQDGRAIATSKRALVTA